MFERYGCLGDMVVWEVWSYDSYGRLGVMIVWQYELGYSDARDWRCAPFKLVDKVAWGGGRHLGFEGLGLGCRVGLS